MRSFYDIEEKAAGSRNQYLLSIAVSRRVRRLKEGAPPVLQGTRPDRKIETALEEISRGAIEYRLEGEEV